LNTGPNAMTIRINASTSRGRLNVSMMAASLGYRILRAYDGRNR